MKISLDARERWALRHASLYASSRDVRKRSAVLIHLADGRRLAPLALAAGVSRPTVYQWVRVYLLYRDPGSLAPGGIKARDRRARRACRRAGVDGST